MKYKLNELPVKTTNNFRINDLEIELDLNELNTNKLYSVEGIEVKQEIKKDSINSRIGLTFNKYLEVLINVDKVVKEPVVINYDFNNKDILISKIIINYQKNASCDFIIRYTSLDSFEHFNYLVEVVNQKENSTGSITYINNLNCNSTNIMSFEGKILENSSLKHNLIDLNGKVRIYNTYLESTGYKSKNIFNNIYMGKDDSIIDMNYYLKNIGKNSYNSLKVEGVLDEDSKKNFRGTLDFIEGSKNSIGEEYENCLLLSDSAVSRSLPMMLCHEEEVNGTHAESTGKISEDKLFYIMSRGMSDSDAKKLIIKSNFTNIINEIKDSKTEKEVLELIDELL